MKYEETASVPKVVPNKFLACEMELTEGPTLITTSNIGNPVYELRVPVYETPAELRRAMENLREELALHTHSQLVAKELISDLNESLIRYELAKSIVIRGRP